MPDVPVSDEQELSSSGLLVVTETELNEVEHISTSNFVVNFSKDLIT